MWCDPAHRGDHTDLVRGALVHAALFHFLGKFRGATFGQNFRLLHPLIAADAAFKADEVLIGPFDLFLAPSSDLLKVPNTRGVQFFLKLGANAFDQLQIIRAACLWLAQQLWFAIRSNGLGRSFLSSGFGFWC